MGCCKTRVTTYDDARREREHSNFLSSNRIEFILLHVTTHQEHMHWRPKLAIGEFRAYYYYYCCFIFRFCVFAGSLCRPAITNWSVGRAKVTIGSSSSTQLFLSKCWRCARDLIVFALSMSPYKLTEHRSEWLDMEKQCVRFVPLFGIYTSWLVTYSAYKM